MKLAGLENYGVTFERGSRGEGLDRGEKREGLSQRLEGDRVSVSSAKSQDNEVEGRRLFASALFSSVVYSSVEYSKAEYSNVEYSSATYASSVSAKSQEYSGNVPSPYHVSGTILGVVEDRLRSEAESGASEERLTDLLEQARVGIEKGFRMAERDIKQLGLMTEALSQEIDKSYSLVQDGLSAIDGGMAAGANNPILDKNAVSSEPEVSEYAEVEVSQINAGGGRAVSSSALMGREELFEFSLQTTDGDIVNIGLSQSDVAMLAKGEGGSAAFSSESMGFELYVKGDLDADEMLAINDLLQSVSNVADMFFNEDFQGAFQAALSVGFDSSQIATFSADMKMTTYQSVSYYVSDGRGAANYSGLSGLADKVADLLDKSVIAGVDMSSVQKLLSQVVDRVSEERGREGAPAAVAEVYAEYYESFAEVIMYMTERTNDRLVGEE